MLPLVLENLTFRSGNQYQPVIDALNIIKRYLGSDVKYFPEEVPIQDVVSPSWQKSVIETVNGEKKVNRRTYELCVLQKALKALKCREVWAEGARTFRNPDKDMPPDWNDEKKRSASYVSIKQPIESTAFVDCEGKRMTDALSEFNRTLPDNPHVKITGRKPNEGRGLLSVAKLKAQAEPENLGRIKQSIKKQYGMIELLECYGRSR